MKKLNNLGFTLIELLAVITIMGILMMVAVPSVSRTIENSRRDTFADNVLTYINTVRNAVLADEVCCFTSATDTTCDTTYSATRNGTYYFKIDTSSQQTKDIMEKVATSSWGGARLKGYVKWKKTVNAAGRTTTTYYARIADTAKHGMTEEVQETRISRTSIATTGASTAAADIVPASGFECQLK